MTAFRIRRNNNAFLNVPQAGAVFVVDNAKGQISMCFPDNKDNKDNKVVVICTPATKLP